LKISTIVTVSSLASRVQILDSNDECIPVPTRRGCEGLPYFRFIEVGISDGCFDLGGFVNLGGFSKDLYILEESRQMSRRLAVEFRCIS
jgi:hypothetical protein